MHFQKISSQHNNNNISIQNCFPRKPNVYSLNPMQNQGLISPYLMDQQNQMAPNQNNYGMNYFDNKNNNNQIYFITPISSQMPHHNYVFIQNPNQNQNQFLMPYGYYMMNENSNNIINGHNLNNVQNMMLINHQNNQNFYKPTTIKNNNSNYYN